MMISKVDNGESMNWATIMYSQLVKKLIRWEKCQNNMIEGTTKKESKKDVCHFTIILEVLFQKWFSSKGAKPQEKKNQSEQPKEEKKKKETLRKRFIKKRPLNTAHIFLKKEKEPKTKTTKKIVMTP